MKTLGSTQAPENSNGQTQPHSCGGSCYHMGSTNNESLRQRVEGAVRCREEQHALMQLAAAVSTLTYSSFCALLCSRPKGQLLCLPFHLIFPMEAPSSNTPLYLKTQVHTTSTKPLVVLFSQLLPLDLPQHLAQSLVRHSWRSQNCPFWKLRGSEFPRQGQGSSNAPPGA